MPEPTSPNHDVSLNPIWRDVFGQPTDPSPARDAIDPGTAETIRQLHALGAAAPPVSSRERVRQSVRASIRSVNLAERTQAMNQALHLDAVPIGSGRTRQPPLSKPWSRVPAKRDRWLWTALSVAAVIAIVLGGIWRYSGSDNGGKGGGLPAISGSPIAAPNATPDAATVEGTLVDTIVANPPSSPIQIDIEQQDFMTGSTWDYCTGASTFVMFMTKGAITVTASSPSELRRGMGGAAQTVPSNQPTKISAGDSEAIEPNANFHLAYAAGAPAQLVSFNLFGAGNGEDCPTAANASDMQLASGRATLSPGPLHLVARRMTLAPNASIPAPPAGVAQIASVDPSSSGYLARSNGVYTNNETSPMIVLVMTLSPASPATATPAP